eukprot:jgi/Hompol1/4209/HPOL_003516-RA
MKLTPSTAAANSKCITTTTTTSTSTGTACKAERLKPVQRNPFSFATLSWLTPLIKRGFDHPLAEEELPDFSRSLKSAEQHDALDGFWQRFKQYKSERAHKRHKAHKAHKSIEEHHSEGAPNPLTALYYSHIWLIVSLLLLQAGMVAVAIIKPLLIPQILRALTLKFESGGAHESASAFSKGETHEGGNSTSIDQKGDMSDPASGLLTTDPYIMAVIMFSVQVLGILLNAVFENTKETLQARISTCLISNIYAKAMRLSPKARQHFSEAKINTLSASDSQFLNNFPVEVVEQLGSIAQIGLSVYFVYKYFGFATWPMLGVYAVFGIFQFLVKNGIEKSFSKYLFYVDKRSRRVREFLCSIKAIKLHGIEEHFESLISRARLGQSRALIMYNLSDSFFAAASHRIKAFLLADETNPDETMKMSSTTKKRI